MQDHPIADAFRALGDLISFTALLGALVQFLPAVASILTIAWTAIRIFETRTVQRWLHRDRNVNDG